MYDLDLRQELLDINLTDNIYDRNYKRYEMRKYIKCRTDDKICLLKLLLSLKKINYNCYEELLKIAKNDFKIANLYLLGLCQI